MSSSLASARRRLGFLYANPETSYLLQRLEGCRGIAILVTSTESKFAPAFQRRIRATPRFRVERSKEETDHDLCTVDRGVAEVLGSIGLILPGLLRIRPGLTPPATAFVDMKRACKVVFPFAGH